MNLSPAWQTRLTRFLLVTFVLLAILTAIGQSNISQLNIFQANICQAENISLSSGVSAWKDGRLKEAQSFFLGLLKDYPNSKELQSNSGFLALEMKDYAGALFHLRKAYQLGERDPQVTKALKTIRESHSRSFVEPDHHAALARTPWYLSPLAAHSINYLRWFSLLGFLTLMFTLYLSLSSTKRKVQSAAKTSLLILSLTILPLSLLAYFSQPTWPEALTLAFPWSSPIPEIAIAKNDTPVLYQPAEDSQVVFMLQSADEIPIIQGNKDWTEISLPGYRKGWVKNSSLYRLSND